MRFYAVKDLITVIWTDRIQVEFGFLRDVDFERHSGALESSCCRIGSMSIVPCLVLSFNYGNLNVTRVYAPGALSTASVPPPTAIIVL